MELPLHMFYHVLFLLNSRENRQMLCMWDHLEVIWVVVEFCKMVQLMTDAVFKLTLQ